MVLVHIRIIRPNDIVAYENGGDTKVGRVVYQAKWKPESVEEAQYKVETGGGSKRFVLGSRIIRVNEEKDRDRFEKDRLLSELKKLGS